MPLSKEEKQLVDILAQRQCNLIHSAEQASHRLYLASLSPEAHQELYDRIMKCPSMDSEGKVDQKYRPHLNQIESHIDFLESRIEYHRPRDTPEDAMWMLKAAVAAGGAMSSHILYNHKRLSGATLTKMSQLHRKLHEDRIAKEKLEKEEMEKAGSVVKEGLTKIVAQKATRVAEDGMKGRQVFQPSDASRAARQPISIQDFERLPLKELMRNTFFVDDPDYADCPEDLTAFEITGRKENREGTFYEVLWEGLADPMDTELEELESLAQRGLWMSVV